MKINIIGSGNVATQLATCLVENKNSVLSIYSRNIKNAERLGRELNVSYTNCLGDLQEADLTIIAIADTAIPQIAKKLPKHIPTVHTSGGVPIEVLNSFERFGIIYPLQTFTKNVQLDIESVPFFIEANNKLFEKVLLDFTKNNLSQKVQLADSVTRKYIHLSAVMTSNFLTFFLGVAEQVLKEKNISLDVLKPLLEETLRKSIYLGPQTALTGPAARGDNDLLEQYNIMIKDPEFKSVFKLINKKIAERTFTVL